MLFIRLATAAVFFSHFLALLPFWKSLRVGKIPRTSDFAAVSFLLYYDIGLALEILGFGYTSPYFISLLDAGGSVQIGGFAALAAAPWLFHLGTVLVTRGRGYQGQEPISVLSPTRRIGFYAITVCIVVPLLLYSGSHLSPTDPIWVTRAELGANLGASIAVLYLPLHLLAFYTRQSNSRKVFGRMFSLLLVGATVITTISIGQRTLLLLPALIFLVFGFRMTTARLAAAGTAVVFAGALLLPIFKWQYADGNQTPGQLISATVSADLSRGGVLQAALERSDLLGTSVLPYPFAGYTYSALFFVPRQIAPFKGQSTAQYFTATVAGGDPDQLGWGFGLGAIEEIALNAGILFLAPGLVLYGIGMGIMDRVSLRVPSLVVASRCSALLICGYNLPSLLLLFGTMAFVGWSLHVLFAGVLTRPNPLSAEVAKLGRYGHRPQVSRELGRQL